MAAPELQARFQKLAKDTASLQSLLEKSSTEAEEWVQKHSTWREQCVLRDQQQQVLLLHPPGSLIRLQASLKWSQSSQNPEEASEKKTLLVNNFPTSKLL